MQYVRDHYGVPAKRGGRVKVCNGMGVITSADHYIHVRLDGQKHSNPYHPTDNVTYYGASGEVLMECK